MTLTQVGQALGEKFYEPSEPDDQACYYVEPKTQKGVALMFEDGRLTRIDVRSSGIATSDGVRVGASQSTLKARYRAKIHDEPHHYTGPEGRYLTLALSKTISVRFEINDDKVDNWYVGLKNSIQYVEGCL